MKPPNNPTPNNPNQEKKHREMFLNIPQQESIIAYKINTTLLPMYVFDTRERCFAPILKYR